MEHYEIFYEQLGGGWCKCGQDIGNCEYMKDKLPTLLDILHTRIQQRDCEHRWAFIGYSYSPYLHKDYQCIFCLKEKSLAVVELP